MFDEMKMTRRITKIVQSWGGTPKSINRLEEFVIADIIMVQEYSKIKGSIFTNKYICADAALIVSFYTYDQFKQSYISSGICERLISMTKCAIEKVFSVNRDELDKIETNRRKYFLPLFVDNDDSTKATGEAINLFCSEYHNSGFIEYNESSPLTLLDVFNQMRIEAEANDFFTRVFSSIDKRMIDFHSD